jgi:hypothetical protein
MGRFSGGDLAIDPGITFFQPGETKHEVFDFLVLRPALPPATRVSGLGENGVALGAGSFIFGGDYGGQRAPDRDVILVQ